MIRSIIISEHQLQKAMDSIARNGLKIHGVEVERYKIHVAGDDAKMNELKELTMFNDQNK